MKSIAFIGLGRLGQTLALALSNASWNVSCVSSRHLESASQFAQRLAGCRAGSREEAAECDLVFLTVPDDAIGEVTARIPWRAGQMVVHCSGSTEVSALDAASARGALAGCFHPLQIFSNPDTALRGLPGSSVAIEGPIELLNMLRLVAQSLEMKVIQIPAGGRALYHAGANYAASFLLPLIHEAVKLWKHIGIDEDDALSALLPLIRGTVNTVESKGLAQTLSGPVSRDDLNTAERHWVAISAIGPSHAALYIDLTRRQLELAITSKRLSSTQARRWSSRLGQWSGRTKVDD